MKHTTIVGLFVGFLAATSLLLVSSNATAAHNQYYNDPAFAIDDYYTASCASH